jgi:hypothetical protein
MPRRWIVLATLAALVASPAAARTARDLGGRMSIDGFATEWADSEWVFGYNPTAQALEEAVDDSKWGSNNDIFQIRVTWDAHNLYLAGEGRIWDNNMMLWIDSVPGEGLGKMTDLTSWRRNFYFDTTGISQGEGFAPDLFAATWDRNLSPRLIVNLGRRQNDKDLVDDELSGSYFVAAATFDQGNTGRSMEVSIPWKSVYLGQANGPGVKDTTLTVGGVTETFPRIPRGAKLLIAGAITTGADGLGGPDVAPDASAELSNEAGVAVNVDNWAIISLDQNDDTGIGAGGPDGIPDWNITPRSRVSFRYPPPIFGLRNCIVKDIAIDRPAFRPDLSERLNFKVELDPAPDPSDIVNQLRKVSLTANLFDSQGRFVRNLYVAQARPVLSPADPKWDTWDGRDERGEIVRPGVYILRLAVEQNICRSTRAIVVVR